MNTSLMHAAPFKLLTHPCTGALSHSERDCIAWVHVLFIHVVAIVGQTLEGANVWELLFISFSFFHFFFFTGGCINQLADWSIN